MEDNEGQNETLTDSVLIGVILERIHKNHSFLTIRLPETDEEYLSLIVELDEDAHSLQIDGLKPDDGNPRLSQAPYFSVSAKLQGTSIDFKSRIVKTFNSNQQLSHKIKYPEIIEHRERRISHRVPVARGLHINAEVFHGGDLLTKARVADLSMEGVGLVFESTKAIALKENDYVLDCIICFDEQQQWQCDIQICHGEKLPEEGGIHLGARFIDMSLPKRNQLIKQLRWLERENIRKALPQ